MTDKQKLALKIVLFLTFPAWAPIAVGLMIAAIFPFLIWCCVDEIVDPPPHRSCGKRAP